MTRPRVNIPPALIVEALHSLRAIGGFSAQNAETLFRRWRANKPPAACKYGREQYRAAECRCRGCREKLAYLFFDQVALKFGRE